MPKAICQICGEVFAVVKPYTLSYPLDGGMFLSPDSAHGVAAPFFPGTPWEDFRCPYGRTHRPMVKDNEIWTDEGMLIIPKDGSPSYIDKERSNEVGRESIIDRCTTVSDEEAEILARKELDKGKMIDEQTNGEDATAPDAKPVEEDKEVEEGEQANPAMTAYVCRFCGKTFKTQQALAAHIGKAHPKKRK